ncbi:benzoate--CoA ligase [Pararhodobacter marinus]|uniref:Benzoate--CoA ligase n=1 Tax=Pararhodobacter marinus TaxID=2184063 RepID=A0A2U2CDY0_9RHOB|nr:class I adenylate-forming enzyme family protein [Pararhodobacter marinus]PWE30108.1 benzoate--CoA ligase [Pararhodobacter marinus]
MHALIESAPFPPCPAPFNLAAYVLEQGRTTPDKIALQILRLTGAERWSYRALEEAVRGIGTGLLQSGLTPGDRVLLRLDNSVDFPLAFLGACAVGLVPMPTSSQLTAPEITAMAEQVSPAAIIAAPGIALPDGDRPILTTETLHGFRALAPCDWQMGDPDRVAYLVFTSGTSGKPRAVMHAHRAVWARRMMWDGWYGLRPDDRLLHAGAFNWTYTLGTGLMDPWAIGATALIPAAGVELTQLPLLLKRFDTTIFAAAPGVYRQMLRQPMAPMPRLRHGLSAGEKLPDETRARWEQATGTPVYEALGMSEVSTYVSASPARPSSGGASGYPQPGRSVAVLGEDGQPALRGEPGVMAVARSDPGLFLGYWGQPEETAATFSGSWFVTGDTVRMDDDGAIHYLGRDDDMMNAGGYRVSPLEVESAMNTHPAIRECAAVEARVNATTSVVALYFVPEGEAPETAALEEHARRSLARYKQPRQFIAIDALPKGANNKINRRALRQGNVTA